MILVGYKMSLVEFLLLLEHNEIVWLIFDTKKLFQTVNLVTYLKIWTSYKVEPNTMSIWLCCDNEWKCCYLIQIGMDSDLIASLSFLVTLTLH